MRLPTPEEAIQFCIMIQAGLPANQAILYFIESEDPKELTDTLSKWLNCRAVKAAQVRLMGKSWQEMTLEERMKYALDQHYSQLAFLLFTNHFGEVGATDTVKLNTARVALESKLAGTAGKTDALSQFIGDLNSGKLKLNKPVQEIVIPH